MQVAAVASSGTGLGCSLNPVPIPQRRSARVSFMTKRQPCNVTCRRLLIRPNARVHTAASASAVMDSGAGYSSVRRKRLAVFVSGGGSNFRSIHEAALSGKVNGDVVALVTDKPGCGGAEYARCNGIPVVVFPKSKSAPEGVSTVELLNILRKKMDEKRIARISVTWRGRQLDVDADPSCTVKEFGQLLQDLTNVKQETLKLIVPQSANKGSKLVLLFSDSHSSLTLKEAAIDEPIRIMGVFEDEIDEVSDNGKRPDLRIIGFDEEERRLRQRSSGRPQVSLKLPQGQYIFYDFQTLHLPRVEVLELIGFCEDVVSDEIGRAETYLILKRNDPGLLWLAKSSLQVSMG